MEQYCGSKRCDVFVRTIAYMFLSCYHYLEIPDPVLRTRNVEGAWKIL
jgi:hypothetical protein